MLLNVNKDDTNYLSYNRLYDTVFWASIIVEFFFDIDFLLSCRLLLIWLEFFGNFGCGYGWWNVLRSLILCCVLKCTLWIRQTVKRFLHFNSWITLMTNSRLSRFWSYTKKASRIFTGDLMWSMLTCYF